MLSARFQTLFVGGVLIVGAYTEQAVGVAPSSLGQDRVSYPGSSFRVLDEGPPSLDHPPVADGIVDRYLLHPRGDVNGLLLRDGSQMHITLRAAEELTKHIQPGDHVRVHGRR